MHRWGEEAIINGQQNGNALSNIIYVYATEKLWQFANKRSIGFLLIIATSIAMCVVLISNFVKVNDSIVLTSRVSEFAVYMNKDGFVYIASRYFSTNHPRNNSDKRIGNITFFEIPNCIYLKGGSKHSYMVGTSQVTMCRFPLYSRLITTYKLSPLDDAAGVRFDIDESKLYSTTSKTSFAGSLLEQVKSSPVTFYWRSIFNWVRWNKWILAPFLILMFGCGFVLITSIKKQRVVNCCLSCSYPLEMHMTRCPECGYACQAARGIEVRK